MFTPPKKGRVLDDGFEEDEEDVEVLERVVVERVVDVVVVVVGPDDAVPGRHW